MVFARKDPSLATVEDFSFSGLHKAGNSNDAFGGKTTIVKVEVFPGRNILGTSITRVDIGPRGINRLKSENFHLHSLFSYQLIHLFLPLEGTLLLGFVTSNPENQVNEGDVFVFSMGLIHFQYNLGSVPVAALNFLKCSLQILSFDHIHPPIEKDILAKAFQVDRTVEKIQSKL
ncbi:unnamed protein product [Coffea canephora]|uniref:Cupin type-1 domain-containing protein n=1 Tax=Coffea canephora TaxID=49390 RepID=A0A068VA60_COFCA|nr:unnamed protein product [Coffea canephora]